MKGHVKEFIKWATSLFRLVCIRSADLLDNEVIWGSETEVRRAETSQSLQMPENKIADTLKIDQPLRLYPFSFSWNLFSCIWFLHPVPLTVAFTLIDPFTPPVLWGKTQIIQPEYLHYRPTHRHTVSSSNLQYMNIKAPHPHPHPHQHTHTHIQVVSVTCIFYLFKNDNSESCIASTYQVRAQPMCVCVCVCKESYQCACIFKQAQSKSMQ